MQSFKEFCRLARIDGLQVTHSVDEIEGGLLVAVISNGLKAYKGAPQTSKRKAIEDAAVRALEEATPKVPHVLDEVGDWSFAPYVPPTAVRPTSIQAKPPKTQKAKPQKAKTQKAKTQKVKSPPTPPPDGPQDQEGWCYFGDGLDVDLAYVPSLPLPRLPTSPTDPPTTQIAIVDYENVPCVASELVSNSRYSAVYVVARENYASRVAFRLPVLPPNYHLVYQPSHLKDASDMAIVFLVGQLSVGAAPNTSITIFTKDRFAKTLANVVTRKMTDVTILTAER